MTRKASSIGIVEDDDNLLDYLASVISNSDEFELVFSAPTVKESLEHLSRQPVDLCLVDLNLPDGRGVDVIKAVKQTGGKALVLSVLGDRVTVMEALAAGADGYLLKSGKPETIAHEIQQTLSGLAAVSPQVAAYLLKLAKDVGSAAEQNESAETDIQLTAREREILDMFVRGLSYREAAQALNIAVNTVSDHVRNMYAKLNVHSRSEAVFEAQSLGLIDGVSPPRSATKSK